MEEASKDSVGAVERLLQNDRMLVGLALALLCVLAAGYTVAGVGMNMSAIDMTRMAGMVDMAGPRAPGNWTLAYATLVFLMWWLMMIAMMLPSAAPAILLHAALTRKASSSAPAPTASFASGYMAVWAAFSLAAAALQWGLESAGLVSATMMTLNARGLAGALLIAAGLYQFSLLKNACLSRCRSPVRFLVEHRRPGAAGAFAMGVEHGAYCAGCCAFLMLLLFAGGIMNLYWIVGLALLVAVEKLAPFGRRFSRFVGVVLIGTGTYLIAAPLMVSG